MPGWIRVLPNLLTGSRLFFAAFFLLLLGLTDRAVLSQAPLASSEVWKLDWAFVLFVIAGITDILDGPLARRLKVTSQFGRSFDPLVDKILIVGGFAFLAIFGQDMTSIAWWMVILVIARELLVTVVRSLSESRGREFAATWAGKLKMFLQSFAIGTVIIYVAHCQGQTWAIITRDISVWAAVIATAASALIYLPRMKSIVRRPRK